MTRSFKAVVVAVAALLSLPLFAQDLESLAGMRLRFDAPGARSAAMGGATEALTDSFSVATNPASLARQNSRSVAVETREISNENPYITGGTIGSFTTSSFETTSRNVAGAVVVFPNHVALYYDEPLRVSADTTTVYDPRLPLQVLTVGMVGNELVSPDECVAQTASQCVLSTFSIPAIFPAKTSLRLRRYGAAAARAYGRLSLGGAVQYAKLGEDARAFAASHQASGGRVTWNAGMQFELAPRVRVGGSYRSGATYDGKWILSSINVGEQQTGPRTFSTPASYAAGIAAEVTSNLTLTADAVRVMYSDMLDQPDFVLRANGAAGAFWYDMPDVTELHAGAEYRLPTRLPVALRAGAWREPAHRAHANSNIAYLAEPVNGILLLDQDENHVTAGIGVGDRVRLDAAYDQSENTSRASLALSSTF